MIGINIRYMNVGGYLDCYKMVADIMHNYDDLDMLLNDY